MASLPPAPLGSGPLQDVIERLINLKARLEPLQQTDHSSFESQFQVVNEAKNEVLQSAESMFEAVSFIVQKDKAAVNKEDNHMRYPESRTGI